MYIMLYNGGLQYSLMYACLSIYVMFQTLPLLQNYKNPCWWEEFPEGFQYPISYISQCRNFADSTMEKLEKVSRKFQHQIQQREKNGKPQVNMFMLSHYALHLIKCPLFVAKP